MELKRIDKGQTFDFGKTARAYAAYRDIYPHELYELLRSFGVAADGTVWLDLGTGTGILPKNLYNPNADIIGVDISEEQILFARKEAEQNGRNIRYLVSPAETTDLPDHAFDAVTAAQCFWYFNRDKMREEIRRLLKPGGVFIKIYMSYTIDDPIASKSHRLVKRVNKNWTPGASGARDIFDDLFPGRVTETFFADLPFTRESWHGRMCACRGTLASMDAATFAKWERRHLKMLSRRPESFTVKHKIYISYFILDNTKGKDL